MLADYIPIGEEYDQYDGAESEMVDGEVSHRPDQFYHEERRQERIESECAILDIVEMERQFLALPVVDFDEIIAAAVYADEHGCHELPWEHIGDDVDAIDAAGREEDGEHHDGLVEIEARIKQLDFFPLRPGVFGGEKTREADQHDDEEKRAEKDEISLQEALADAEQEGGAAGREEKTGNHGEDIAIGDQKGAGGGNQEEQDGIIHGEAEALEEHVQDGIEKHARNDVSQAVHEEIL